MKKKYIIEFSFNRDNVPLGTLYASPKSFFDIRRYIKSETGSTFAEVTNKLTAHLKELVSLQGTLPNPMYFNKDGDKL